MIPDYPLDIDLLSSKLPVQQVFPHWIKGSDVALFVLRLDLTDLKVSGNKWFKLAKNLSDAKQQGHQQLLTFGGAFSNHVYSFSKACAQAGLKSVAVIRGEELTPASNPMLESVAQSGTRLLFVDRRDYRRKYDEDRLAFYRAQVGDFFLIPEGGSNPSGVLGAESIGQVVMNHTMRFDHLMVACGTGATLAGIVRGVGKAPGAAGRLPLIHGLSMFSERSVESGKGWLIKEVAKFVNDPECVSYRLHCDASQPGYGQLSSELVTFADAFLEETGILLDPVYTLKLMAFIKNNLAQGLFDSTEQCSRILCVHTGGLHGWLGYADQSLGADMPAQLSGTIKQRLFS